MYKSLKLLRTMTPPLTHTSTTAMQMLPLLAATSITHRGPSCPLTLARSFKPPLGAVASACVRVSPLHINRQ